MHISQFLVCIQTVLVHWISSHSNMNRHNLNVITWNATGIMSSSSYLCNTLNLKSIDICGISEHWLYEKDLNFLNVIDNNYISYAVSDNDLKYPGKRRVGKGGVAILWHKKHSKKVFPLSTDDDRILGIRYELTPTECAFFFQVYLPCSNHSIAVFRDYMDRLYNIIQIYSDKGTVVLMGDINAYLTSHGQPGKINSRSSSFGSFLHENNLVSVNTLDFCTGAKSSFVSYDCRYESLIDHIIIQVEKVQYVVSCEIMQDDALNVSRHRPILCCLYLPTRDMSYRCSQSDLPNINWKKINEDSVQAYKQALQGSQALNNITESVLLSNTHIDQAYSTLVLEVKKIAKSCFPEKKFKRFLKPYWNCDLQNLHTNMKLKRATWLTEGKPRNPMNTSYREYKMAKRDFRRVHRKYVDMYLQSQNEEIDRAAEIDSNLFWRLVNAKRSRSNSGPGTELIFNGQNYNTSADITEQWAGYFEKLYSPSESEAYDDAFKTRIDHEMNQIKRDLFGSSHNHWFLRDRISYPSGA